MKIHPKAVAEHRDLVINCLDDDDTTIRMRSLDLLEGMVLASFLNSLNVNRSARRISWISSASCWTILKNPIMESTKRPWSRR